MNAIDGYQRAALALRALDPQEQEWLLNQLEHNDQQRLAALLGKVDEAEAAEEEEEEREAGASEVAAATVPTPPPESAHPDVRLLESVHGDTLRVVMDMQPAWVVALVLAHWRKNLVLAQYVARLGEAQCKRIYGLAESLRNSIKPRARDTVLRHLAAEAERHENVRERRPDFDEMLVNFSAK